MDNASEQVNIFKMGPEKKNMGPEASQAALASEFPQRKLDSHACKGTKPPKAAVNRKQFKDPMPGIELSSVLSGGGLTIQRLPISPNRFTRNFFKFYEGEEHASKPAGFERGKRKNNLTNWRGKKIQEKQITRDKRNKQVHRRQQVSVYTGERTNDIKITLIPDVLNPRGEGTEQNQQTTPAKMSQTATRVSFEKKNPAKTCTLELYLPYFYNRALSYNRLKGHISSDQRPSRKRYKHCRFVGLSCSDGGSMNVREQLIAIPGRPGQPHAPAVGL